MFEVRRFSSHSVNRNLAQFANEVSRGFTSRLQTVELDQREGVRLGFTRRERKKKVHLGSPWNAALTFKKKSGRLPPRKKVALTPNFRQIQVTREEPRKKDERYDQYCRATFQISRSMARLPDHFFQDSSLARRWQEDSHS